MDNLPLTVRLGTAHVAGNFFFRLPVTAVPVMLVSTRRSLQRGAVAAAFVVLMRTGRALLRGAVAAGLVVLMGAAAARIIVRGNIAAEFVMLMGADPTFRRYITALPGVLRMVYTEMALLLLRRTGKGQISRRDQKSQDQDPRQQSEPTVFSWKSL